MGFIAKIVIFLGSVLIVYSAQGQQCVDIFKLPTDITPFSRARQSFDPEDLRLAGVFIEAGNPLTSLQIKTQMDHRDGTYVLLIDTAGNMVISHRLPYSGVDVSEPHLATHRGLYQKLKQELYLKPQVAFAGEFLVVGGKVIHLIDKAGTFHDLATDSAFRSFGEVAYKQLIESNQLRLEYAKKLLLDVGLLDDSVELVNFAKFIERSPDRDYGHTTAKRAAAFELQCRLNPTCWAQVQRTEAYVRGVIKLGGSQYILYNSSKWWNMDFNKAVPFLGMLEMFLREGVIETLSSPMRQDPDHEAGRAVVEFYQMMDSPIALSVLGEM